MVENFEEHRKNVDITTIIKPIDDKLNTIKKKLKNHLTNKYDELIGEFYDNIQKICGPESKIENISKQYLSKFKLDEVSMTDGSIEDILKKIHENIEEFVKLRVEMNKDSNQKIKTK